MRTLIATAFAPFSAEPDLAGALADACKRRGLEVDVVRLPAAADAAGWPMQLVAWRMLELDESGGEPIDRLIVLGSPAEALRHPAKTVWVVREHPAGFDRTAIGAFLDEARHIHFATAALAGLHFRRDRDESASLLPIPAGDDLAGWDKAAEVLTR